MSTSVAKTGVIIIPIQIINYKKGNSSNVLYKFAFFDLPLKKWSHLITPVRKPIENLPTPGFSTTVLQNLGFLSSLDVLEQRRFWRLHRSGGRQAEGGAVLGGVKGRWRVKSQNKMEPTSFMPFFLMFVSIYFEVCLEKLECLNGMCLLIVLQKFQKKKQRRLLSFLFCPHKQIPSKIPKQKTTEQKKQGGLSSVQFIFFPFTKFLGLSGYLGGSSCHKVCMADGLGRFSWPYIAHSIRGTPSPSYPRDGRAGWTTKAQ